MQREELSRPILTACELFESITSWPSPADYEKYKRWASGFSEQLSLFSIDKDGKYGVEDSLGFKVVKPEYDEIVIHEDDFRQDVFARKDGKWALIVEGWHKLENVSFVSDTLPEKTLRVEWMRVTKNGKQGLYNPFENKWIIAPEYDALYVNDHRQIIITEKGGKYGFYSDDILVPPLYEDIELGMHLSYVRVRQNDEWGFLNK